MEITDYMLKLFIGLNENSNLALKKSYYMEFTALLKLLTDTELGDLRRKYLNIRGGFNDTKHKLIYLPWYSVE